MKKNVGVLLPSSSNWGNYQYDLNGDGQSTGKFKLHTKPRSDGKALKKANISQVITSEKFLDKLNSKGFDFSQVVADKALFMENLGKFDN